MATPEFVYAGIDANGYVNGIHIGPLERAKYFMPDCEIYKVPYSCDMRLCGSDIKNIEGMCYASKNQIPSP